MPFDVHGARRAGYSYQEIITQLATDQKFDLDGAMKAGYRPHEILAQLSGAGDHEPEPKGQGFWSTVGSDVSGAVHGLGEMSRKLTSGDLPGVAADLTQPSTDAMMNAAESIGEGNYWGAAQHALGAVPFVGPAAERFTEKWNKKEYAGALGSMVVPVATAELPKLPGAVRAVGRGVGRGMEAVGKYGVRSSLGRINKTTAATAADINSGLDSILRNRAETSVSGKGKMQSAVDASEEAKSAVIDTDPTRSISPAFGAKAGKIVRQRLANQAAPGPELETVDRTVKEFYESPRPNSKMGVISRPGKAARNLTARETQDMKAGTYKRLGERAYMPDVKNSASVLTEKQIAHEANAALTEKFPELQDINARQKGQIIGRKMIRDAVDREVRSSHAGGRIGAVVGGAAGFVEGGPMGAAIGAIGGGSVGEIVSRVLRDPAIRSQLSLKIYHAGKGLRTMSEAKSIMQERVDAITAQTRSDPNVISPKFKPPSLGLSVESIDTPGKLLPRSRSDMFKVGAALLNKTGNVSTKEFARQMGGVVTPNVKDGWKIATSQAGAETVLTAKAMHAGSKAMVASLKKISNRGGGTLTSHGVIEGRTDAGVAAGGKNWYPGLMRELYQKFGEKTVRRLIKTESIVSPNQTVETSIGQALDREATINFGAPEKQFGRYQNSAGAQYANDVTPSGLKVEPYDWQKQTALDDAMRAEGHVPRHPVGEEPPFLPVDTIHTQGSGFNAWKSESGKPVSPTSTIRAYTDAQLRMEARRVLRPGERGSAAQSSNWVGTQTDINPTTGGKSTPWAKMVLNEIERRTKEGNRALLERSDSEFNFGNNTSVTELADSYQRERGAEPTTKITAAQINEKRAIAMARAYDAMPKRDARAKPAYEALRKEVDAQWDRAASAGYTLEPWTQEGQPYASSKAMLADVRDNQHLFFFTGGEPHPFLSGIDPKTGLSANSKFRAVHDLFGHAKNGLSFGPEGEEAAWRSHVQMFSPLASKAMTAETRGQSAWVNFGKQNYDAGKHTNRPMSAREYAPQKAALLPDEFNAIEKSGRWGHEVDYGDEVSSIVLLKSGRVLESAPVPANTRNLQTHLQVITKAGVDPSEVVDTGFRIGSRIEWDAGGGSVMDRSFTLGEHDAKMAAKKRVE